MASREENLAIIKKVLEEEKAQYAFISNQSRKTQSRKKKLWLPRYEEALKALDEISAENIHLIQRVLQSPNSIPILVSQPNLKSVKRSWLKAREPALKALEEIKRELLRSN